MESNTPEYSVQTNSQGCAFSKLISGITLLLQFAHDHCLQISKNSLIENFNQWLSFFFFFFFFFKRSWFLSGNIKRSCKSVSFQYRTVNLNLLSLNWCFLSIHYFGYSSITNMLAECHDLLVHEIKENDSHLSRIF